MLSKFSLQNGKYQLLKGLYWRMQFVFAMVIMNSILFHRLKESRRLQVELCILINIRVIGYSKAKKYVCSVPQLVVLIS